MKPLARRFISLLIFLGVFLSACESSSPNKDLQSIVPSLVVIETEISATQEVARVTDTRAVSSPTATPTIEMQMTPTAVQPREGLVASDPETVNLSSGNVQLVEFFAFW